MNYYLFIGGLVLVLLLILVVVLLVKLRKHKVRQFEDQQEMIDYLKDEESYEQINVYQDSQGNVWRTFKNPLRMPAMRSISAEVAAKDSEMNMTSAKLEAFLISMRDYCGKGDLVSVGSLIDNIMQRLTMAFEEETLLNLALCYFMIEGEPDKMVTEEWNKKKRKILSTDMDAKAFFLRGAFKFTRTYGDISEVGFRQYLMERQMRKRPIRK